MSLERKRISNENKSTYFRLGFELADVAVNNPICEKKINLGIDHVLFSMGVRPDIDTVYKSVSKDSKKIQYIFRGKSRKRLGQLTSLTNRHLSDDLQHLIRNVQTEALTEKAAQDWVSHNSLNEHVNLSSSDHDQITLKNYSGRDLDLFKSEKNFYPWQKDVFNMLYEDDGKTLKQPDDRTIHIFVDRFGNSGKSSFLKYLTLRSLDFDPKSIGRTTFGSASQIRSQLANQGARRLYFVDLTRSRSKQDSPQDLFSSLEDLKSGFILNLMYGANKSVFMAPPWILVFANDVPELDLVSQDRWSIYEIKNKKLGPKNALLKIKKKEKRIKK